jgi:hypothetical protein
VYLEWPFLRSCKERNNKFDKADRDPFRVLRSKTYESDVSRKDAVQLSYLIRQEENNREQQCNSYHPLRVAKEDIDLVARGEIAND